MKKLISAEEFCENHHIEVSFVRTLRDSGLIEITNIEQTEYIQANQLKELESIVHLYYELDINLEGIETIYYLMQRMNSMHDELTALRNRLRFYETDER